MNGIRLELDMDALALRVIDVQPKDLIAWTPGEQLRIIVIHTRELIGQMLPPGMNMKVELTVTGHLKDGVLDYIQHHLKEVADFSSATPSASEEDFEFPETFPE